MTSSSAVDPSHASTLAIISAVQAAYASGDSRLAGKLRRQFKHAQIAGIWSGPELEVKGQACVAFAVPENLAITLADLEGTPLAEEAVNLGGILLILQSIDVELEGKRGVVRAATWIRFAEGLMQEIAILAPGRAWDDTYRFVRIVDARAILPWEDDAIRTLVARAPCARTTLAAQYALARFGVRDNVTSPWRLTLDVPADAPRLSAGDARALGERIASLDVVAANGRSKVRATAFLELRDARLHALILETKRERPVGTTASLITIA